MKINWTDEQASLLRAVAPQVDPVSDLDEDTIIFLTEEIGHHLVVYGFDAQYRPNRTGLLCESIIDKLTEN